MNSATEQEQAGFIRRLWARFLRSRVATTFAKFFAGSTVGLAVSQVVLLSLYGSQSTSAWLANLLAFVAGAIPNFLLNRRWAWGRKTTEGIGREILPYAIVVGTGGLISAGIGSLAERFIDPLQLNHFWQTVLIDVAYLFSLAITFIFKFVLLDRFVFRHAPNGADGANAEAGTRPASADGVAPSSR